MNLLSAWVVLAPGGDELGEVVGPEDGGVPGQVVEAKHQRARIRQAFFVYFMLVLYGTAHNWVILEFLISTEKYSILIYLICSVHTARCKIELGYQKYFEN
jgi:hypothetical protein